MSDDATAISARKVTPVDGTLPSWPPARRYLIAVAATAAAVALRALLQPWLGDRHAFDALYGAVAIAVWVGGYRPAVVATVLGYFACDLLFMGHGDAAGGWTVSNLIGTVAYGVSCGAIIALGEGLRSTRNRLRVEQHLLSNVLASIDDHFVIIDRDWRYVYSNQRNLTDAGVTRDDLLGKTVWDAHPGLAGTEYERVARRSMAEQRPGRVTFHFPPRDRWFDVHFYPSHAGLAVLATDVTDQRRAKVSLAERITELGALYEFTDRLQQVRSLAEAYEAALDAMREGLGAERASVLLFDDEGVMRFVAWRGLSDAYRVAVNGHSPWTMGTPDATPIWVTDIREANLEEWLVQRLDAEEIRALGFVPLIAGGVLIGKFMLYRKDPHAVAQAENDLALTIARQLAFAVQRQRADEAREASAAALQQANARKDEFLTTLAHELRNPLAPMVNMLAVVKQSEGDPALLARGSEIIERQVHHLVRLVDDLLDVARINHDRLELRPERVDLASVVRQAVDTCQPLLAAMDHQLTVTLPEEPVWLQADPVRLAQVLGNLLNNACKYTRHRGRIELLAECVGDEVVVSVRDDGIGIPPEMLERVFDLFNQLDGSLERSHGGLGIGLTLVKRLVEMHGGRVEAFSDGTGTGSRFVVRLPVPVDLSVVASAVATPPVAVGRRILVVDDNVDGAESLAVALRLAGHETHLAHDGVEALALAHKVRPEVILLDIGMPRLNGFETCRAMRETTWGSEVSVIALTGWGQEEFRERSRDAGFDAHLVKPVDHRELATLIARPPRVPLP